MNIRNFCIIAHIDHGKSTLADRMLEITGTIKKADHGQVLDKMDLEQERGITIKLTPARMNWKGYQLNLIDTPGHVDFQYEVSRSLASVEGAILLVDATQGIQAQTLSTLYMALDYGLEIIPVLNKIDLPAANPERVAQEIENLIGLPAEDIIKVSAKTGENVEKVLDAIIERIPLPSNKRFWIQQIYEKIEDKLSSIDKDSFARALIFDSVYDKYRGVVLYVRVTDGNLKVGDKIKLLHSDEEIEIRGLGYFAPDYVDTKELKQGEIGYIVTGLKSTRQAQVGDTILKLEKNILNQYFGEFFSDKEDVSNDNLKNIFQIPGFKKVKPFIYAGVYPIDTEDYEKLRDGFEKLSLNDSAIVWEPEVSKALGQGFRAGFLGTLHMEIVKERLKREFDVETIFTTPNVIYLVKVKNYKTVFEKTKGQNIIEIIKGGFAKYILNQDIDLDIENLPKDIEDILKFWMIVRSPADMPDMGDVDEIMEPIVDVEIVGPSEFSGNIMELAQEYRGVLKNMEYIDDTRVLRKYKMPMGEIIVDFYDRLKSSTKGYATMNYEFVGYQTDDLIRLDILINNERVESFSLIVHRDKAYYVGRELVKKLKELIPKHLFPIPLQAAIGTKIIARETIPALKKDVLAKCYGGDVTRKRKLLQKQKEGKKRLKQMGKVSVPNDIFIKMTQR